MAFCSIQIHRSALEGARGEGAGGAERWGSPAFWSYSSNCIGDAVCVMGTKDGRKGTGEAFTERRNSRDGSLEVS